MNKLVYVVESDGEQRDFILKGLQGFDDVQVVGCSGNGLEAVGEIENLKPDCVLTGIALAGLDGYGLIERVRTNGIGCSIIVLSALSGDGFITRAINMGADYYMVKPVDMDGLHDKIVRGFSVFPQKKQDKGMDERITNIFMSVGIPAHIKGYQFLREAVKLAVNTPDIINSITKGLYPTIARNYQTTPSKVERAIRHAIEVAWNKGRIENINSLFGVKIYTAQDKPTNGEFIALVADKMLLERA